MRSHDGEPNGSQAPRGWGDTNAQGVLSAISRRWWVVVLCVLILVGAATAVGLQRKPTYTASSSVNVGQVDVRVQALSSFVTGASSLASSYARIATSQQIVVPVARDLGTTPGDVSSRLTVAPVPASPIFEVRGSGADPAQAVRLTNAVVKRMRAYVAKRSSGDNGAAKLLTAFGLQARRTAELQRRYERLKARRQSGAAATTSTQTTTGSTSVPSAAAVTKAQVAFQTAQLKLQSVSGQYQSLNADTAGSAGVELLNRAVSASSDRKKVLQRLLAVAIVAGIVIGSGLALLLDRSASRRRRPAAHPA